MLGKGNLGDIRINTITIWKRSLSIIQKDETPVKMMKLMFGFDAKGR